MVLDVAKEIRLLKIQHIDAQAIEEEIKIRNLLQEELMEFGSRGSLGNIEENPLSKYSIPQLIRILREMNSQESTIEYEMCF